MANEDFHKVIRKDVEFIWPRLDQTYRYNSAEKRTEPCSPSVQGAAWSIGWLMDEKAAKDLAAELKVHYQSCVARNSKLPSFNKVFGAKKHKDKDGNETGMVQFTAERKAIANNGAQRPEPTVVDNTGTPLADKAIWGGSRGDIRVFAVPTQDPDGNGGIKLLLDAVVVRDAVYGGDSLSEDFDFDSSDAIDSDPPKNHEQRQAPAQTSTPIPEPAGADEYGFD